MSRNIQTVTKWLPLEIQTFDKTFNDCQQLKKTSNNLIERIEHLLFELTKKIHTKFHHNLQNELDLQEFEDVSSTMNVIVEQFTQIFPQIVHDSNHPELIDQKMTITCNLLWKQKQKICYFIHDLIAKTAHLFIYYGEALLNPLLKIASAYNQLLQLDQTHNIAKKATICTNTSPYLHHPMRKTSVTRLLQLLALNRAETCCHKLIDCLLDTYNQYEERDDDQSDDDSSVEIYRALTRHLSPPRAPRHPEPAPPARVFPSVDELIAYEAKNVLDLLEAVARAAPAMLGADGVRGARVAERAKTKVLAYYEQILWTEIGGYLEHIVLWWASSPLAARAPQSSQHLREWIAGFVPTAEVPGVVLAALASLGEALGVHVALTAWDGQFRRALVAAGGARRAESGRLFGVVLQELVALANRCEVTPDWIVGAPLDELPLVEQIPVLHRLDHSIHTTRLWAVNETKKIANTWNVDAFFAVTHQDVINCTAQLGNLRLADHSSAIAKGGLGVHVQVCALMRAKLVSEVQINFAKLKETPKECVSGLASVCRTISLANLQMIYPPAPYWQHSINQEQNGPSAYVEKYLNQILMPVINASDDPQITNMILQIICESWLDHIYTNRIKFSQAGAGQLLADFGHIETWLRNCATLNGTMRDKMLKNEILRRCEGVGRLLLRCPGEQLKMTEKTSAATQQNGEKAELMPAEMYVPNQEQWLELRAMKKRNLFKAPICCGKI